ncbi:MAG TPA: hypothetical protein VMU94_04565 [Streptosporangiaceae bacterium]|nr:hypothetical protein [Streptosporangiaceae bacterium]
MDSRWCFARSGKTAFFAAPGPAQADTARIDEAPILAALGYHLATDAASAGALANPWCAGAARLSERDPFPLDRMSFFFRPIELLGLAVGAAAISDQDPQARQWLAQLISAGGEKLAATPWAAILAFQAAAVLGQPAARIDLPRPGDLSAADLAALCQLIADAIPAVSAAGIDTQLPVAQRTLLEHIAIDGIGQPDVAEAAVLHLALTEALQAQFAATPVTAPDQALSLVTEICRGFPAAARRLTHRHAGRPGLAIRDEYDVQDLLHALLAAYFDDIRPEEPAGSRAGAASRMDFLLKKQQIVVEAKMTRRGLDQRKVAEELIIDKERYRAHPDCKTLVCFVYDPGHRCINPSGLEADLTDPGAPLPTITIVAPHN